jgi:thiamine monophosphate synthase
MRRRFTIHFGANDDGRVAAELAAHGVHVTTGRERGLR